MKFSRDVISVSDIKSNPGRLLKQVCETHRPALLTSRGRGVAVLQALSDYEHSEEERAFMRAVVQGLLELEEGKEIELGEAKRRLGIS